MSDFRTNREIAKGWQYEPKATVPCILPADGLLAVFHLWDVESILDKHYHSAIWEGEKHWYFDTVGGREIAETDGGRVYANPQVLWRHFMNGGANGR